MISIILFLLVAGFVLWMIKNLPLPIDPFFRTLIIGVFCFAMLLWALNILGFYSGPFHTLQ